VSIRDVVQPGALITYTQITGIFLLGLVVYKGGKLTTLDQQISTAAVTGDGEAWSLSLPSHGSVEHYTARVSWRVELHN
jgi:hypothetical protein